MDLTLLTGDLEVAETPGLRTTDPRFLEISSLILEAKYSEAANIVEGLLKDKIYDIRLVGYFLFNHFLEVGPQGLQPVTEILCNIFTDAWDAFGPTKNKEKAADTTINWFCKSFNKTIDHKLDRKDSTWQNWIVETSLESIDASIENARNLSKLLLQRIPKRPQSFELLLKSIKQLESIQKAIYKHQTEEAEAAEDEEFEEEEQTETMESPVNLLAGFIEPQNPSASAAQHGSQKATAIRRTRRLKPEAVEQEDEPWIKVAPQSHGDPVIPFVEGSYPLTQLIKKLHAFEVLVQKQEYQRAAIIAADLETTINSFDPLVFLPKLFGNYTKLISEHIGPLSEYWEEKEGLPWQAMQKHFEVSLEDFVNSAED